MRVRTPKRRTVALTTTLLGVACLGVSLFTTPAGALDSNPKTRELKESQQNSTVGDVSDGDCGTEFDVDDGVIWHFIADKMVDPSTFVSWSASFSATDGGPIIETVTETPEIKVVGGGKTWHFYTQSQNLFLVTATVTLLEDQTEVDMQLSHICGESVPDTTTEPPTTETPTTETPTTETPTTETPTTETPTTETPTTETPTTETPTTETPTTETPTTETPTTETPTTETPTTAAATTTAVLGGEITTSTTADPGTTTTASQTQVSGVQIVRAPAQLPRTGGEARTFAYAGFAMVFVGVVLLGHNRRLAYFEF